MKAAEYAISLAKKYNAQLFILYVLYSELGFAYSNLLRVTTPKAIKDVLETQKKDVQKWFKEIKNKLKSANISVVDKIIISASSIVGEIVGFADNEKIDNNFGNETKNWF
jgi:nucleotide-binding universal stress UspA family protein